MEKMTHEIVLRYMDALKEILERGMKDNERTAFEKKFSYSVHDTYYITTSVLDKACTFMFCDDYRLLIVPFPIDSIQKIIHGRKPLFCTTANENEGGENWTRIYIDTPEALLLCSDIILAADNALKEARKAYKALRKDFLTGFTRSFSSSLSDENSSVPLSDATETPAANSADYVVLDTETTGYSCHTESLIELAAVKVRNGQIIDSFQSLVAPSTPLPENVSELTGITSEMLADAPDLRSVLPDFIDFIGELPFVGHNIPFDLAFINEACAQLFILGLDETKQIDTLPLSREKFPGRKNYKLKDVAAYCGIPIGNLHRALDDCELTMQCYEYLKRAPVAPAPEAAAEGSRKPARSRTSRFVHERDIVPATTVFDPRHPFYKKVCVVSGTFQSVSREEILQMLADAGAELGTGITKKTDYFILGHNEKPSGKEKKAAEYIENGIPIQTLSEDDFFALYAQRLPEAAAEPETDADAPVPDVLPPELADCETAVKNFFASLQGTMKAAPGHYDLNRMVLKPVIPKKSAPYWTILFFQRPAFHVTGKKTKHLEIAPGIVKLLKAYGVAYETPKSTWPRMRLGQSKMILEHPELATEIYEDFLRSDGFDCCSRYQACSDAGHCVHDDIMFAGQCRYRQKLKAGQNFFPHPEMTQEE